MRHNPVFCYASWNTCFYTHTISGSIIGVGSVTNISGIKWKIAMNIVLAWVLTIPASALISALSFYVFQYFHSGF